MSESRAGGVKRKKGALRLLFLFMALAAVWLAARLAPILPIYRLSEAGVDVYFARGDLAQARETLELSQAYLAEMEGWLAADATNPTSVARLAADSSAAEPGAGMGAATADADAGQANGAAGENSSVAVSASAAASSADSVKVVLGGPQPLSAMGSRRRTAGYYWKGIVVVCDPDSENPPLSHELAHWVLERASGGRELPRWFSEGFAQYAEFCLTGFALPVADGVSRAAALEDFSLSQLDPLFDQEMNQLTAYYYSFGAFNQLLAEFGWPAVTSMIREFGRGGTFEENFASATGRDFEDWENKSLPILSNFL